MHIHLASELPIGHPILLSYVFSPLNKARDSAVFAVARGSEEDRAGIADEGKCIHINYRSRRSLRLPIELKEIPNWGGLPVPDVYFTHGYHEISAGIEAGGTQPLLIEVRSGGGILRLPLLIRPLEAGLSDATSCYGYGGPWWEGDFEIAGVREAIDAWARERGIVCTFLRLHPLCGNRAVAQSLFDVVDLNETVEWPLAPDVDLLAGMRKKHRQYTRKSEREGLTSKIVLNPTDLEEFASLYLHSMDRLDAGNFYRFPEQYWSALSASAEVETVLVDISLAGETVASLLCLSSEHFLHAHLLGSNDVGREKKANYLAYAAAAQWAQANGKVGFHLGGGYGTEGADLLNWKQGFCPKADPRNFSIAKAVHIPEAYRVLAGTDSTEGFFPPWRVA